MIRNEGLGQLSAAVILAAGCGDADEQEYG